MVNTGFSEITLERLNYRGSSPWYLEVAITGKCNFSCKYCNRFNSDLDIESFERFLDSVDMLHHIQITGGEPTVHPEFERIVTLCRNHSKRVGLSTNGSKDVDYYLSLPVDMFSLSFDDYDHDILRSRGYQNPQHVENVIRELSKSRYVNIGLFIDHLNVDRAEAIVDYVLALGVTDIKLSTSSHDLGIIPTFSKPYSNYPILSYRVNNFMSGKAMRGFPANKCNMLKNDVTIVGNKHYPCLVYFREGGNEIGCVDDNMMSDRVNWSDSHNCKTDPICSKFCMDFKCDFNSALEGMRS